MEIKEAYVSFDTAKLLKEKGFDEMTDMEYNKDGKLLSNRLCGYDGEKHICVIHHNLFPYPAPTQQMACEWLREFHHKHIEILCAYHFRVFDGYGFEVYDINLGEHVDYASDKGLFSSAKEACEEAIKYCLTNLI